MFYCECRYLRCKVKIQKNSTEIGNEKSLIALKIIVLSFVKIFKAALGVY